MTSACWASTARITICRWPLSAVPGLRRISGIRCGAVVGRRRGLRGRRQQGAEDLHALQQVPDAGAVEAADDGDRVVGRVDRDDRELVAGDARDHVHVVAGLDDRADTGDLVDLDGARLEGRAASRCRRISPWAPPGDGGRGDRVRRSRPGWRAHLADDLGGLRERTLGAILRAGAPSASARTPDLAGQRDVGVRDEDEIRWSVACSWSCVSHDERSLDERNDARKTPTSRTRRLERFKLLLPERLVTGGTTVAPA